MINKSLILKNGKKNIIMKLGGGYEEALELFNLSKNPQCTIEKQQKLQVHTNFNNTIKTLSIIPAFKNKIKKITNEEKKVNEIFKNIKNFSELTKLFKDEKKLKKEVIKIRNKTQKLCKSKKVDVINLYLDSAIQDFDKLCLTVGCKHSFTGVCYNN